MEKNFNIQRVIFFLRNQAKKQKKVISITYLIIVLIKMWLLIFFVFSQYRLACKYGIILHISVYNWMQSCVF